MNTKTVQQPSSVNEAKSEAGLAASGWFGASPNLMRNKLNKEIQRNLTELKAATAEKDAERCATIQGSLVALRWALAQELGLVCPDCGCAMTKAHGVWICECKPDAECVDQNCPAHHDGPAPYCASA